MKPTYLPAPCRAALRALAGAPGLLLAAVLLTMVAGCGGADRPAAADAGAAPTRTSQAGGTAAAEAAEPGAAARSGAGPRLLLTGELRASDGYTAIVPRTRSWQVQLRWLVEDGTEVEAGDRLVELDNSTFTGELEDQRLQLSEKESQLERRRAELAAEEADARFRVRETEVELARAEIQARVPEDLLARRELEERRLALAKARADHAKAEEALAAQGIAARSELAQLRIDVDESRRQIAEAEEAIEALVLTAPYAGVAVVADHPWEPRKLQPGDNAWVGMPLVRLPDLAAMNVEAKLSDVDQGRVGAGDRVLLTLDAYPDESFSGTVTEVSPIAREERGESLRRFFDVLIEPDRKAGDGLAGLDPERMRPGMSVKVERERASGQGSEPPPEGGAE